MLKVEVALPLSQEYKCKVGDDYENNFNESKGSQNKISKFNDDDDKE